jgi:hypothetical protein
VAHDRLYSIAKNEFDETKAKRFEKKMKMEQEAITNPKQVHYLPMNSGERLFQRSRVKQDVTRRIAGK